MFGNRQIKIVATQYQMLTNRDAMKLNFVSRVFIELRFDTGLRTLSHSNQCKVSRATTNITNQYFLADFDL